MNIGIVGTFDVKNYGDLLFPLIAERELRERLGDVVLHRFSYNAMTSPGWPYAVTSLTELPDVIAQLDGLLIGGGDLIRFDTNVAPGYVPPAQHIHHPTGYWLEPALIALAHGVPVIWNAPGVPPREIPPWAKPLLELALGNSSYISVRDNRSKATLAQFVDGNRIAVVPDTAFGISRLLDTVTNAAKPYIVVQPVRLMTADFAAFVNAYADRFEEYMLISLPIGPILGDDSDVLTGVPGVVRLPVWPNPLPLAEIVSNASAVIGESYHLAITALAAGVPVFSLADFDNGKYGALRDFETVHAFSDAPANGADWFFARLGKSAPAESVRRALPVLARHWDRVAAVIASGRVSTDVALGKFLQSLPTLFEEYARRD